MDKLESEEIAILSTFTTTIKSEEEANRIAEQLRGPIKPRKGFRLYEPTARCRLYWCTAVAGCLLVQHFRSLGDRAELLHTITGIEHIVVWRCDRDASRVCGIPFG